MPHHYHLSHHVHQRYHHRHHRNHHHCHCHNYYLKRYHWLNSWWNRYMLSWNPCSLYVFDKNLFYRISDKYFKRHVGDVNLPFQLFQFFAGLNVWVSWNASRRISRWLMFLKITLSLIRSPNVSASSWKCPFRSSSLSTLSLKLGGRNVGNFNGDQNLSTRPPIVRQAFTLFWYQLPPPLL